MTLPEMFKLFLQRGAVPNEVLVDREGTTLDAQTAARKEHQWDIIYFRSDGYTVAADFYLAPYVIPTKTDPEKPWVGKIYRGERQPRPM
jgi:hypothetical protein